MYNTVTVNINDLTQEEINQPKKKRKFRTMTNAEFCDKHKHCSTCTEHNGYMYSCYWFMHGSASKAPYRTTNGKYILVEVKE